VGIQSYARLRIDRSVKIAWEPNKTFLIIFVSSADSGKIPNLTDDDLRRWHDWQKWNQLPSSSKGCLKPSIMRLRTCIIYSSYNLARVWKNCDRRKVLSAESLAKNYIFSILSQQLLIIAIRTWPALFTICQSRFTNELMCANAISVLISSAAVLYYMVLPKVVIEWCVQ